MSPIRQDTKELFKQSDEGYLQFLVLFLKMQISCLQILAYSPSYISEQEYAERQLVKSLTLIDNILMHQYNRDVIAYHSNEYDLHQHLNNHISEFKHLIAEYKLHFSKYHFVSNAYEDQCKRLIDQISRYFFQGYVEVIIIDNKIPLPWMATQPV